VVMAVREPGTLVGTGGRRMTVRPFVLYSAHPAVHRRPAVRQRRVLAVRGPEEFRRS